jgi:hypothetical protein
VFWSCGCAVGWAKRSVPTSPLMRGRVGRGLGTARKSAPLPTRVISIDRNPLSPARGRWSDPGKQHALACSASSYGNVLDALFVVLGPTSSEPGRDIARKRNEPRVSHLGCFQGPCHCLQSQEKDFCEHRSLLKIHRPTLNRFEWLLSPRRFKPKHKKCAHSAIPAGARSGRTIYSESWPALSRPSTSFQLPLPTLPRMRGG